jgi:LacI family transcriptional regulator
MNMRRSRRSPIPSERKKKLVALAMPMTSDSDWTFIQEARAVLDREQGMEVLVMGGGYESSLRELAREGGLAGVIGEFLSTAWLNELLELGVKVVRIGGEEGGTPEGCVCLSSDVASMGEQASRVLIAEGGLSSIGYLGPAGTPRSARLLEEFRSSCERRGVEVKPFRELSSVMLAGFLRSLGRPCGVLCAGDGIAGRLILAALREGVEVPRDLAVIGIGDERLESLRSGIPITSFALPMDAMGRRAGECLLALLEGKDLAGERFEAVLHERGSSLRSGSGVERAKAWIRSNPAAAVNAGELARIAGMSRRAFEIAFRTSTGNSPGEWLRMGRQARAERMLLTSSLSIGEVGRLCGYPEPAAFSAAFSRWTGRSPKAYRSSSFR